MPQILQAWDCDPYYVLIVVFVQHRMAVFMGMLSWSIGAPIRLALGGLEFLADWAHSGPDSCEFPHAFPSYAVRGRDTLGHATAAAFLSAVASAGGSFGFAQKHVPCTRGLGLASVCRASAAQKSQQPG